MEMALDFDRDAKVELKLEKVKIPDWDFCGVQYPYDIMRQMWRAYRDHGVLYTEFMAQPPEWWDNIDLFEAMYNTRLHANMPDGDAGTG